MFTRIQNTRIIRVHSDPYNGGNRLSLLSGHNGCNELSPCPGSGKLLRREIHAVPFKGMLPADDIPSLVKEGTGYLTPSSYYYVFSLNG